MKMVENVMNNLKTTKKEKVRKTRDIKSNYEFTNYLMYPFASKKRKGEFNHSAMYSDINIIDKIKLMFKALPLRIKSLVIITIIMQIIYSIASAVAGMSPFMINAFAVIWPLYVIFLLTTYNRILDSFCYMNNVIILSKHHMNRYSKYYKEVNKASEEEIEALDNTRGAYNKYLLFPTNRELEVLQVVKYDEIKKQKPENVENCKKDHKAMTFENRIAEHKAFYNMDPQGYKEMVEKYKKRTVPTMQKEIENILNQY